VAADGLGGPAGTHAGLKRQPPEKLREWVRIERAWWAALAVAMLTFSAFPIANLILGFSTKDYGLWYRVGLAVRQGLDVYPRPETGRLFPFMYPPPAATMLAWLSMLGHTGLVLSLVFVISASWLACIVLSTWLAVSPGTPRHPLVLIIPSLASIVLIYNIYLLGQPNLLLLALLLGAFACLRCSRHVAAGAFVATAAAIKAFPILALPYLLYRRMWVASASTVVVLAGWLLVAPLAFRTPKDAIDDLIVWSGGMVFTYNSDGIAQRPIRSYSYKNQSLVALAQRLLRDVPADGESVLSQRARAAAGLARPPKGLGALYQSNEPLFPLNPHAQEPRASRADVNQTADFRYGAGTDEGNRGPASRWSDALEDSKPALRAAWRVNFVDLDFRTVMMIALASMLTIGLFVAAVLPPETRRTRETDAIEFALVILLIVMFTPLSFNYAYVWLIYPTTLALHRVLSEPADAPRHRLKVAWIVSVLLIPALALLMPLRAQAYGNLFFPALILVIGLGAMLYSAGRRNSAQDAISSGPLVTAT
jgi:hypothetical protein